MGGTAAARRPAPLRALETGWGELAVSVVLLAELVALAAVPPDAPLIDSAVVVATITAVAGIAVAALASWTRRRADDGDPDTQPAPDRARDREDLLLDRLTEISRDNRELRDAVARLERSVEDLRVQLAAKDTQIEELRRRLGHIRRRGDDARTEGPTGPAGTDG